MSPAPARRRLIFTVFTRYSGAREYTNPLNPKPVASMLLQGLLSAYYMLYKNGAVGRPVSHLQLLHEFHHHLYSPSQWMHGGQALGAYACHGVVSLGFHCRRVLGRRAKIACQPPSLYQYHHPQGHKAFSLKRFFSSLLGSTGNKCSGYGTPVRRCPRSGFCLTRSQPAQAGFSDRRISLGPLTSWSSKRQRINRPPPVWGSLFGR
jgi:hypothetical protein